MTTYRQSNGKTSIEWEDWELGEEFDELLNEADWPTIAGMSFAPADILKNLDPTAYRIEFIDWLDAEGWVDIADLPDEEDGEDG